MTKDEKTQGVTHDMFITKLRKLAVALAAVSLVGIGLAAHLGAAAKEPDAGKPGEVKKDEPKGKTDPASCLEVRLTAKKGTYTLPPKLGDGVAGAPLIVVDFLLELRNTSDKDVHILVGGSNDYDNFSLEVKGPAVKETQVPVGRAAVFFPPRALKLAPGKGFEIPIKMLNDWNGKHFTWEKAGEYTVTASYKSALLPAPKDAKQVEGEFSENDGPAIGKPGDAAPEKKAKLKGFGRVTAVSNPIKVKVEAAK